MKTSRRSAQLKPASKPQSIVLDGHFYYLQEPAENRLHGSTSVSEAAYDRSDRVCDCLGI